ncbi:MAG: hypothetical protein ACFB03_04155 [Paracoccaceae bacterium]
MASTLIRGSRIEDETATQIVWGFACGAPVGDIAWLTSTSVKTVRQIVLALRHRLVRPAFNLWNPPGETFVLYDWGETQAISEQAIYAVFARCYFNKRCASNFIQGRRTARICSDCAILSATEDPELSQLAVDFLDYIRAFYQHLGIGGERSDNQAEVVRLRWRHTLITLRAKEASKLTNGIPEFDDPAEQSCRALHDRLIADLQSDPLTR